MKKQIGSALLLLSLIFCPAAHAQQTPFASQVSNVGTAAAAFLNIGAGARANAMGGAFAAVANDVTALYWNPAGINLCSRPELTFTHLDWFLDIHHEFVGALVPVGRHAFGASLTYLGVPDQEVRTIAAPEGAGKFYQAFDLALGVSYGFQFTDQFGMGFTAKYIREQIYHSSGQAGAIDLGALYRPTRIKWLALGMAITNFGSSLKLQGQDLDLKVDVDPQHNSNERLPAKLETDAFALPLVFRFGLAATPIQSKMNRLVAAIDLIHPSCNTESLNLGLEYVFRGAFALRGGFNSLFERDYQTTNGFTFGGGLKWYTAGVLLILDYAYRDFGMLSSVSWITWGVRF